MNFQRFLAIIVVIIGAVSYGVLSPMIKIAYDQGFTVSQITPAQITMGTVLMWLIVGLHRKSWRNPFRGPWLRIGSIGIFGLALTLILYNTCLIFIDVSLAIVLLFQFAWITIFINCISEKRRPSWQETSAVVLVMVGTLLAVNIFSLQSEKFSVIGLLLGLGSGFSYAWLLFMMDKVKSEFTSAMKSAVMLTLALPVIYLTYIPTMGITELSIDLVFWGLVLGILGQVIPTLSFNYAIPKIGSSLGAILGSVELPAAVIAALFILNEPILWIQWIGILVILIGIIVSEKKSVPSNHVEG